MNIIRTLCIAPVVALVATPGIRAVPQALEIGQDNVRDLPGGREADGIIGDFVLRNDRIEAVISGNQHQRRANMFTNSSAPTPGCLYDLTLRRADNDQITCFAPASQEGTLSSVRVLKDGSDGEAIVRAELTAAAGRGLARTHDYILRDGWAYVLVVSTFRNEGTQPAKVRPSPAVRGLFRGTGDGEITVADGPDPAYKQAYAYAVAPGPGFDAPDNEVTIEPGRQRRYGYVLAVGTSPAAAYGELAALRGRCGRLRLRLRCEDGSAVTTAAAYLPACQGKLVAYPDENGLVDVLVPVGRHEVRVVDLGRPEVTREIDVPEQGATAEIPLPPASRIAFDVRDETGRPLPCKVQFIGRDGTRDPDLGPTIRAHGCDNQYQSENGRFTQAVPPGKYHLVITRGIEYDHAERDVDVPPASEVRVEARLRRVVDTRGWVSCDFHNHTTASGDNYCGKPDRIINLAAENIEFAPTTEHNRVDDWKPVIDALGLAQHVATVSGIELTGGGPHLNSFPLPLTPHTQGNGAPSWYPDPRMSALALRNMPGDAEQRWVQLNHPHLAAFFNDRNRDSRPDGGFVGLEGLIDGCELMSAEILSGRPRETRRDHENWGFLWLQMLNAGRFLRPVVVSDAHEVTQGGVGGWRTYVPSGTDEPGRIDPHEIIRNAKAGRLMVTTGPFLEVRTAEGRTFGDTLSGRRDLILSIRVQCNTWTGINRVAVLVNGRLPEELNFTRTSHPHMFPGGRVAFDQRVPVRLEADAHLIVVAVGEGLNLATAYGHSWQKDLPPIAFHNPIFVDVDGDGFRPNGDTLDHEFLPLGSAR